MPDMMEKMDIAFPNLNIYLRNVPKSFSVFGFEIALYGVIIGCGFLFALLLIAKLAKKTDQNPDEYWDLAIYLIVFSIIGARIYYVLFAWDSYKSDPISVLYIRNGGLAIYGGVIAGFLTVFIYSRIKKKAFLRYTDTIMPGLVLGQAIGRWGNFTNREVFGEYTNGLFAMRLPIEMVRAGDISELMREHMSTATNYVQVSPTFLYESLWNVALLIILLLYIKRKKFDGEMTLLYLGGYGLGRAWIEFVRTDRLYIAGTHIPVSMALAIVCVVFAVVCEILVRGKFIKPKASAENDDEIEASAEDDVEKND